MRGLVLEGGGALGAYQAGAMKALHELGLDFDGAVGTSIGSVNSALYVQGGPGLAEELWKKIDVRDVFNDEELTDLMESLSVQALTDSRDKLLQVVSEGGIDPTGFLDLLKTYIEEDVIRQSHKDYGLVTFSISKMKGMQLFKEDIPYGHMEEFILASCYVVAFKRMPIMGDQCLDGAVSDNLPFSMLLDKGYDELYLVRSGGNGIVKKIPEDEDIHEIAPREKLGNVWDYTHETVQERIRLGYNDVMVYFGHYQGLVYSFKFDIDHYKDFFIPNNNKMDKITQLLGLPQVYGKENFYIYVLPKLAGFMDKAYPTADEIFLFLIEHFLNYYDYPREYVYDERIFPVIASKPLPKGQGQAGQLNEIVNLIFI